MENRTIALAQFQAARVLEKWPPARLDGNYDFEVSAGAGVDEDTTFRVTIKAA
jgi:hypothetical protein